MGGFSRLFSPENAPLMPEKKDNTFSSMVMLHRSLRYSGKIASTRPLALLCCFAYTQDAKGRLHLQGFPPFSPVNVAVPVQGWLTILQREGGFGVLRDVDHLLFMGGVVGFLLIALIASVNLFYLASTHRRNTSYGLSGQRLALIVFQGTPLRSPWQSFTDPDRSK